MKNYIIKNLEPILLGVSIAIFSIYLINKISDIIIQIALIK